MLGSGIASGNLAFFAQKRKDLYMLGKLLYNFIESPIIPLDFTSEQISSCKKYATDKFLSQYPSFSNKTIRNAISDDSKLQIVNLLSEYFDEGVQLLRNKQK